MHALSNYVRPRGLVAALNNTSPAAILAQLSEGFATFKAEQAAAIDDINARLAAMTVGGIGEGGDPMDSAGTRRKALNALANFGRSGKPEDLTRGLTVNNALSTDSSSDGGYITGEEVSGEIMRVQRNDSAMRRIARVVTHRGANFKQPFSLNNAASGWVGERQARPETDAPKLALVDVPAGEVYANPAITQTLLDDSMYDAGAWLSAEIADAFNAQEGAAFISGDGINKPKGFLSYDIVSTDDASRDFGKLQYIATGASADFNTTDPADPLIEMVFKLKAKYRQNARWLMNSKVLALISKFKDKNDQYLYQRSLVDGTPGRLLGYPVEIDEDMSDVGSNAFPVAFGDWQRGYIITDRAGLRLLRDPYTNKPYVMFYATKRVGGGLLDSNAIKVLKCAGS